MTDLAAPQAPVLDFQRLVLVVTGSAAAAGMPFWVSWLRTQYPELQVTTVVTRSAQRFVTRAALAGRTHGEVLIDEWPPDEHRARHVELAEWAEAFVVYPATLHFIARLALGLADSPALLAAQCSAAPIVIAPALPPGGMFSAAFRTHWSTLSTRENIVLVAPQTGVSLTTGRPEAWAPPPLPEVLEHLAEHRLRLATPVIRTVPS